MASALDLSVAAGPAAEKRQGDDQEDSRIGRLMEGEEGWGKGRPTGWGRPQQAR